LNKSFWKETITYASYLINRLPLFAIGRKIPMEMQSGKAATDYDMIQ